MTFLNKRPDSIGEMGILWTFIYLFSFFPEVLGVKKINKWGFHQTRNIRNTVQTEYYVISITEIKERTESWKKPS